MAAAGFSFEFKGLKESRKRTKERDARAKNLQPAFRRLGPIGQRDVKKHFRETTGPRKGWTRKKPRLVAGGAMKRGYYVNGRFRQKPKTGIGVTGNLSRTTAFRTTQQELILFNPQKYGGRFHGGFTGTQRVPAHTRIITSAFGRRLRFGVAVRVKGHSKTIDQPARPFMWLSPKARATIRKGLLKFIVFGKTTGK